MYRDNGVDTLVTPGDKGLSSYGLQPKLHAIGRKPYSEALSPKAVLELQPYVESVVTKKILELEGFAESGQVGAGIVAYLCRSIRNIAL